MATISSVSESKFIGSPIVYRVTPGSVPSAATFHSVRLLVEVFQSPNQYQTAGTFEFSSPVSGDPVDFDIASAFRAVSDKYQYTATELSNYPAWTARLTAFDDYLLEGEEQHIGPSLSVAVTAKYVGRLTDRERLLYGTTAMELPDYWTRKPMSSPEVCFVGNPHLQAGSFGNGPAVSSVTVATGMATINNDYKIYGISQPADGFELRFINSLGVHDNVFVTCLRQSEVNIKTDFHIIAGHETIREFNRGVTVKQNDYEQWKMSSGPVDFRWLQWWLHEPLMAKWAWINVDSSWLPVHIVPEDTTTGIDRAKGNLLEVQFTLRFDINGSPFK